MANPGPASTNTPTVGSGGSWPEGYKVGNDSQSPVSFFGVSPAAVQRSGGIQGSLSNNPVNGLLINMTVSNLLPSSGTISATTISPVSVNFQTCNMVSSTDLILVNKITAQAGMGIVGARVSTISTALISYINMTNSNVTHTASEPYIVANLRGLASTVTLTPPVVPGNATLDSTFTVTGVVLGQLLYIQKPTEQLGLGVVGMRIPSNDTVNITYINNLTTAVTPTAGELYSYVALNNMVATNSMMVLGATVSATGITGATVTSVTIRVTGMQVTDQILGASRPNQIQQDGLGLLTARVSAADLLELTYINTVTPSRVTPTSGEFCTFPFIRPLVPNPMILQQVTLTPTIVGALTTAEVSFAVSSITVSSCVWVNKPTYTSGLGVVGARVVSTNVIGITYVNNTSVSITPPAETYTIGNFPTFVGVGHQIQQQVATGVQQTWTLTQEQRQVLVSLGVMAGS